MTMVATFYSNWQSFTFKGKKFLVLIGKDGNSCVFGEGFSNYGSWMSMDNFKNRYAKEGESLKLPR